MENNAEKLTGIFNAMEMKKSKADILKEYESTLITAKNNGKTWKQLLEGLEQMGVKVSEKTLVKFLKDKLQAPQIEIKKRGRPKGSKNKSTTTQCVS